MRRLGVEARTRRNRSQSGAFARPNAIEDSKEQPNAVQAPSRRVHDRHTGACPTQEAHLPRKFGPPLGLPPLTRCVGADGPTARHRALCATRALCACGEARHRRVPMPACAGARRHAPRAVRCARCVAARGPVCTPPELDQGVGGGGGAASRRCSRSRRPACMCWRRCSTMTWRPGARKVSSGVWVVRRWRAACPARSRAARRAHDAARTNVRLLRHGAMIAACRCGISCARAVARGVRLGFEAACRRPST